MNEYEICIICKKNTKIKKNVPITQRKYYVEGAGQLCSKCFHQIYDQRYKLL